MAKPVELQYREADCEATEEKIFQLKSALLRMKNHGTAPPSVLYQYVVHAAFCADCRSKVALAGCADWVHPCICGKGIDLGTVCLHRVEL